MPDDRSKLVRERLVVQRDEIFRQTVEQASKILKLDEHGGIHPVVDISRLTNKQRVELFLLGRLLAYEGKLLEQPGSSGDEIARFFGMDQVEVGRRISDLKNEGKVEVLNRGEYRLIEGRLPEVLSDVQGA